MKGERKFPFFISRRGSVGDWCSFCFAREACGAKQHLPSRHRNDPFTKK